MGVAVAGFTGTTNVAVTNASGAIVARAEIVFNGGAITINGVASSPANFLTDLNAQLGGVATADFTNGVLSLQATNGNHGVVVAAVAQHLGLDAAALALPPA